jgi:hypothetical protein
MWNEGGLLALAGLLVMLSGALITVVIAWIRQGGYAEAVCGFSTVALFAIMVNAVPHAYGRFWTVPVLLALAPAITLLNEGPRRRRAPWPAQYG